MTHYELQLLFTLVNGVEISPERRLRHQAVIATTND